MNTLSFILNIPNKLIKPKTTERPNIDKKLKTYQSNTYNEFNRFGNLKEYRFYQFVVAYKRALENYYKDI